MSANKIISDGELSVGQKVTVLAWKRLVVDELTGDFLTGGTQIQQRTIEDNSFKGDVLEIKAVDLPFIIVKVLSNGILKKPIKMDTRRVDLMELSNEYVAALLN